ncbi:Scr1 family TA system antitoxin-like transcriptional regulator [Kitasatospora purpeofusca]|uniref:Scr1 family TA system antitoxin-like transcriptional regulator n=1 Tax=Kitasatospora purpeofusca TaxID=67352 RepID=UPI0035E17705
MSSPPSPLDPYASPTADPDHLGTPHSDSPRLGYLVLGRHLRHLRECQDLAPGDIADRLPAFPGLSSRDIADLEAGHGPVLREAAAADRLRFLLRAYGADTVAVADFHQGAAEAGREGGGRAWPDSGAGAAHRYQLLEQDAEHLLLAAVTSIPGPLRTAAVERGMWMEGGEAPLPPAPTSQVLRILPTSGCQVCRIYRADLLADQNVAAVWQQAVAATRKEALDQRIRRPGPVTTLLIDEALLHRGAGSSRAHAEQMAHLADLVRTTRLQVRVVPLLSGAALRFDTVELGLDGRTITANPAGTHTRYLGGEHHALRFARDRAHGPDTSLLLLKKAADGTLRRPDGQPW